jgi:hypothetical protein
MTPKQVSNDTRHNDIQHKDTQHNNIQHIDIQHTETQHNNTQLFNTQRTINITSPSIATLTTIRVLQFAHYP